MSNAKLSDFNNEFIERITHNEDKQRKYKPLTIFETPYNVVFYLYFDSCKLILVIIV